MKNLDIYINGSRAVYDNKTLIGSILRNFDLTDPSNRKQLYTNTMKLPVAENQHIFGFASQPGYVGTVPYDRISVEIIVDGFLLVKNGIGYLSGVQDGYYLLNVREQPAIIQTMQDTKLEDLTIADYTIPGTGNMVQRLINSTSKVKIDYLFNDATIEDIAAHPGGIRLFNTSSNLTYYIADIFTQIATDLGITWAGSLFSDTYFMNMRMVLATAAVGVSGSTTIGIMKNIVLNENKTVFEFFKAVLQAFGAVYKINGSTITVEKFDDITLGKVSWAGKLSKVTEQKYNIPNLAQKNYYRVKAGGDADDNINQAIWTCDNKNIEDESTMIEPDITCYPFVGLSGLYGSTAFVNAEKAIYLPDSSFTVFFKTDGTYWLVPETTINDLVFVIDGAEQFYVGMGVEIDYVEDFPSATTISISHTIVSTDNLNIATYYNSQNDYLRFGAMIEKPLMYKAEFNLSVLDLNQYDPFNIVIVPELAGEFYVNSLQYNFEKQGKASKATLIKYVEP